MRIFLKMFFALAAAGAAFAEDGGTAKDFIERGGTVVRVSSNPKLRPQRFQSPQALYEQGGIEAILADTQEKDELLRSLGINVNFAPVADLSTNPNDFIYDRTLGQGVEETGDYIAQVVEQMSLDTMGSVLKHFPGYGDNVDTHTGIALDQRPLELFWEREIGRAHV